MSRALLLGAVGAVVLSGCGPKAPPPRPMDPAIAHIGAWFGTGMAFPDGELCLVFCPDGRLFSAAGRCGTLDSPRAWTWTREGELLRISDGGDSVPMRFRPVDRNTAMVDIPSFPSLPLDRVGDLHAMCLGD